MPYYSETYIGLCQRIVERPYRHGDPCDASTFFQRPPPFSLESVRAERARLVQMGRDS